MTAGIAWMEQLPRLLVALGADARTHGPLAAATVGGMAARLAALAAGEGAAEELLANRAALREALAGVGASLEALGRVLEAGDAGELARFLKGTRR